jgi:hypothetical protein
MIQAVDLKTNEENLQIPSEKPSPYITAILRSGKEVLTLESTKDVVVVDEDGLLTPKKMKMTTPSPSPNGNNNNNNNNDNHASTRVSSPSQSDTYPIDPIIPRNRKNSMTWKILNEEEQSVNSNKNNFNVIGGGSGSG